MTAVSPEDRLARLHLVDFTTLFAGEAPRERWLARPLIPEGRLVSIAAAAKTGKSLLAQDIAASLATGAPVLGQANPYDGPVPVLYLDWENTPSDARERFEAMGYGADSGLQGNLHYAALPAIAPLNTPRGSRALLEAVLDLQARLVVIDTRQRSVEGKENDAGPPQEAYRLTYAPLKHAGVTVIRLDHLGKDIEKGTRGHSALRDDVDVEWRMTRTGPGVVTLASDSMARQSWVPAKVVIRKELDPVRHLVVDGRTVVDPTVVALAAKLDELGVDLAAGRQVVQATLAAAGVTAKTERIAAAMRWRREVQAEAG